MESNGGNKSGAPLCPTHHHGWAALSSSASHCITAGQMTEASMLSARLAFRSLLHADLHSVIAGLLAQTSCSCSSQTRYPSLAASP